jgi:hypothetical protein
MSERRTLRSGAYLSDNDDDLPEVSEIIQQARAKSSAVEKCTSRSSSFTENEQDHIKREPGIKQEPKIKKEVIVKEENVDSEEF